MGQSDRTHRPRNIRPAERAEILLEGTCYYCGCVQPTVVDHLDPVVEGGGAELGNLVAACMRCNSEKGGRTPSAWRQWRMRRGYPWPPPNTDNVLMAALEGLTGSESQAFILARHARDATIAATLDRLRDLDWIGVSATADENTDQIRHALIGAEKRIAGARARALRRISSYVQTELAEWPKFIDSIVADPTAGNPSDIEVRHAAILRKAAVDISEFSGRFLSPAELDYALILIADANSAEAWTRRIVAHGQRAVTAARVELSPETQRKLQTGFARRLAVLVAGLSAAGTDAQNTQIRRIIGCDATAGSGAA